MTRLYYWLVYRRLMKVMHHFGWHHMKHCNPHPIDERMPWGFLKCEWCGIHSDVPYSMKEASGRLPKLTVSK